MTNDWIFRKDSSSHYDPGPFFRTMWLICAFDLPTDTKEARKRYARYRNLLLHEGFNHLQHSIYLRHFPNYEQARAEATRLGPSTPEDGRVDFLFLTDRQLGLTLSYYGPKTRDEPALQEPSQGELF